MMSYGDPVLTSGSLFTGYGGLDMAVEQVLGTRTIWHAEHEPPTEKNPRPSQAAARLLAHRHPNIPNLADITAVDWRAIRPPAVLTGGFPCHDLSVAGGRAGLIKGVTRSGLWGEMARAIDALRPDLVVVENVRGLLHARAGSDVEPCPWCLGDDDTEPAMRALGAVLADLADLGYDARWCGLPASAVGAPHGRYRVFIAAWPAGDTARSGWHPEGATSGRGGPAWQTGGSGRDAADPAGDRWDEGRTESAWLVGRPDAAVSGDAAARRPDDGREGREERDRRPDGGQRGALRGDAHGRALPTAAANPDDRADDRQRPRPEPRHGGATLANADQHERPRQRDEQPRRAAAAWGSYGPAIERWERVLGRVAPAPTEANTKGGQRLSPAFVEWMMGLPAGHVTDVPGISRNDKLKMLGNGVVPQQAAAALEFLLAAVALDRVA